MCYILTDNVEVTQSKVTARLTIVKGQAASTVQIVGYGLLSNDVNSPVDLLFRWSNVRGMHHRFFALPGE